MQKVALRRENLGLIPAFILTMAGAIMCSVFGHVRTGNFGHRFMALVGLVIFIVFATVFLHIFTKTIYKILVEHDLRAGRAGAVRFGVRIIGYVIIILSILSLLQVPIGRLIIGGAAVGIILGVAAQQALANFFASIVLIIAHPYSVGETIVFNSGALGGMYKGKILDIGLTHTLLQEENGSIVHLPNATLLSNAAIRTEADNPELKTHIKLKNQHKDK